MFDNTLITSNRSINYPTLSSDLSFRDYITRIRALITERRLIPQRLSNELAERVLNANSPFELYPEQLVDKYQFGALLIHGLMDSPYTFRDIATRLKMNGILSRAILLPGHGTLPRDLLHISYQDWINTVRYGIEVMQRDVDKLFLIGYSTGATLSLYHALQPETRKQIAGIILLAPAIRIRGPIKMIEHWEYLTDKLSKKNPKWLYYEKENDYAKYRSLTFNAVNQVARLINLVIPLYQQQSLDIPVFMIMSNEDEIVSSHKAIELFSSLKSSQSKLLLYSASDVIHDDKRIQIRTAHYPDFFIKNFSHVSIPFAFDNQHYGQQGDYSRASHINTHQCIYGAYNRIETRIYNRLHKLKLTKYRRLELTYNPDFDYMADQIVEFIKK